MVVTSHNAPERELGQVGKKDVARKSELIEKKSQSSGFILQLLVFYAWQRFPLNKGEIEVLASLCVCVWVSALGLSEQTPDPADQGLDEGVSGSDLAVQALHLQQLSLQSFSETCNHVALQLRETNRD